MSAETVFIVNPLSAGGVTLRVFEKVRRRFADALGPFEVRLTEAPRHATLLTRQAIADGARRVVSVGGDGTNSEVLSGFFDEEGERLSGDTRFAHVTSGTGGDFRRTFGWGEDPATAITRLKRDHTEPLDVGRVRLTRPSGETEVRLFANISSAGLGGAVDDVVNRSSKALGAKMSFLLGSARALLSHRAQRMRVTLDDNLPRELRLSLLAVCNGQYFGGGMWVAPAARTDDGLFDVVLVSGDGLGFWARHGPKIYSGRHLELPEVEVAQAKRVRVEPVDDADGPILLDVDGEQPGVVPASYELLPGAVQLVV